MRSLSLALALAIAPAAYGAPIETFLEAALATNPDIAAAEARYDGTKAGVDVARSYLLPSVRVTGSYVRNIPEVKTVLPFGEEPLELVIQPADQLGANARITVPLIVPGAVAGTTAAARQADAGAEILDSTKGRLLLAVVQSYWGAVAAQRVEDAAKESLTAAQTSLAIVKGRYDLAAATLIDLRRAEAEEARGRQALLQAEVARKDAQRRLVTLTGVEEAPDADPTPRVPPEGDLVAMASSANPELRAAQEGVEAARAGLAATSWQYAPTVAGFATAGASNATGFSGETFTGNAGVQLDWNLFDGGGREGRVAQGRASVREAEARLESVRRTVLDDVASAVDDVEAARLKVEAAEIGVSAANEAMRLADEESRLGAIDASTLALVRRDALQSVVLAASAEMELGVAVERLRYLVGEPLVD